MSEGTTGPLPPRVPNAPKKLARAIQLLGSRTQWSTDGLSPERRNELVNLVGAWPETVEIATIWKTSLKKLARRAKADQAAKRSKGSRKTPEVIWLRSSLSPGS